MCRTANWRWHIGAFGLYAVCAWLTLNPGGDWQNHIIGGGGDAYSFIWFLTWWPWAISHHIEPVYSHLVWQPDGLNLLWTASVPALSIIAAPLTGLFGAILCYNVLIVSAPLLAAYAAYWLCFYIAGLPVAALIGGYLYGFSSYEMSRVSTQLNLSFTALVPMAVLAVLMRMDDRLSRIIFCLLLSVVLIIQFGISTEVFATEYFFGGAVGLSAYIFLYDRRTDLLRLAIDLLIVTCAVLMALSPVLWAMFVWPHDFKMPAHWPRIFVTDFMNFLVPTSITALNGTGMVPLSERFTGFLSEQSGYLGVPLCLMIWLYGRNGKLFLVWCLIGISILSLGPYLYIAGVATGLPLPWIIFGKLPLLSDALPSRFMLFASLIAAIIAARWISQVPAQRRLSAYLLGALSVLSIWPMRHEWQTAPYLRGFEPGQVASALGTNPRLLILPFGASGASMFWQAEDKFGFNQPAGYLGYPPARMQADIPEMELFFGLPVADPVGVLVTYSESTNTDAIVVTPDTPPDILKGLNALGWHHEDIDDVTVYKVPKIAG